MSYIYFLKSLRNNKIYTGTTDKNPKIRLIEHNARTNKWTKENGPFILLYFEEYLHKDEALKREKFYKSGFGRQIRDCIIRAASAKGGPASGGG